MTFAEGLDRHLASIAARDLEALAATVAADCVLITADAGVIEGRSAFLDLHRAWFTMPGWSLETERLHIRETADLAIAVLALSYRPGDDEPVERSVLTLGFRREEDRWLMVHDQNTPEG
jgi:uncharacterized protein (TIGR02246 family)